MSWKDQNVAKFQRQGNQSSKIPPIKSITDHVLGKNPTLFNFHCIFEVWRWEKIIAWRKEKMCLGVHLLGLKFDTFWAIFWHVLTCCASVSVSKFFEISWHLILPTKSKNNVERFNSVIDTTVTFKSTIPLLLIA